MGKPRTKRQQLREERKQKRKAQQETNLEAKHDKKRRRTEDGDEEGGDFASQNHEEPSAKRHDDGASHPDDGPQRPEREFFGMLDDDEQEYFRRADELLELNQFPSDEERDFFLQNVYREAVGKELKLASSQSLSRLMERLILLSTAKQKKHIFTAFAGHFMSLVQHRFASHCCEALFLQSAPVVTQELGADGPAFVVDTKGGEDGEEPENSMENLFLLTLDEFEEHLSFLLTDRFASHTLRVLLVVLSGRPLEDSSTRTLLKSKKKERITVQGHSAGADETKTQLRAVPGSFTMATKKIIQDAMQGMDFTSLRVLAKHPTGNPLLQLLLELDIALNHKDKSTDPNATLLYKLLPDAPGSLSDPESQACDLINSLIYDPIGSRLLETLITHCPGKVFKPLHANILGPRIATYVRNDVASYAALRAINRFSKDDLVPAIEKILPIMPVLVSKARYNVVKTLYERCTARSAPEQIPAITRALTSALGSNSKELVPKLCGLEDPAADKADKPKFQQDAQNKTAMAAHGAHLVSAMLATPGVPAKVAQNSLLALSPDQLFNLATQSAASANVLTTALSQPSPNNVFHKAIVSALVPRTAELALNSYGHRILEVVPAMPSRGARSVPFHVKQTMMSALAARERELRESWAGRSTWRAWRGDVHKTRPYDWTSWAKEADAPAEGAEDAAPAEVKLKPWQKMLLKKKEAEAAAAQKAKEGDTTAEKAESA